MTSNSPRTFSIPQHQAKLHDHKSQYRYFSYEDIIEVYHHITMDPTDSKHQKWFPLESNPNLMNNYIHQLGWDISQYHLVDVFSTDDWALEMIPTPVLAVLLLYPLTPVQLQYEQQEKEQLLQQQQKSPNQDNDDESHVWFIKQRIGNACGTIGLLHAMMNAVQQQQQQQQQQEGTPPLIQPGSWLDHFYQATATTTTAANTGDNNMTAAIRRAELLENDPRIATYHDQATSSTDNQTSRGTSVDDDIITHFIALVAVAGSSNTGSLSSDTTDTATPKFGHLYELDGRKGQPICHATITDPNTLLREACTVIKEQFMARDPNELRFTILALAKNNPDDE